MRASRRRRVVALTATVLAALPAGRIHAAPAAARTYIYTGPRVGMRWGPVRATIDVRGYRIINVKIDASGDIVRSRFLRTRALPQLRQETLAAQSVYINAISGATQTSEAYIESLSKAIADAHRAGTLR